MDVITLQDLSRIIKVFLRDLFAFKSLKVENVIQFLCDWKDKQIVHDLQFSYLFQQMFTVLDGFKTENFPEYNKMKIVALFAKCIELHFATYETLLCLYQELRAPKFNASFNDIILHFDDYCKKL